MPTVFVLEHIHVIRDDYEDVKLIGIYSSLEQALLAMESLKKQAGFCDYPELLPESYDGAKSGFYVAAYPLDKSHWLEGFVTL